MSHSVGVLSEGVHSFLDLVSAAISYFTVKEAGKPADEDHPFGHGKIETLSSLFESLLLALAGVLIIYEAIHHLLHPEPVQFEGLAIGVICLSMVISYLVFRHNSRAAKEAESMALHVNAQHFLADVMASLGVIAGLVILKLTDWLLVDSIIAFAVAGYILSTTVMQVKKALMELSDTQLPEEEIQTIRSLLIANGFMIETHDLRTRKSGATRHIDFHLVVCGQVSVEASHAVCDELELKITEVFPRASVNIHVEPCEKERTACHLNCPHVKKRY